MRDQIVKSYPTGGDARRAANKMARKGYQVAQMSQHGRYGQTVTYKRQEGARELNPYRGRSFMWWVFFGWYAWMLGYGWIWGRAKRSG